MIDRIFKILSYSGYAFCLWGFYIAIKELYLQSDNLISNTGLGIFLTGVGISLVSLSPEKELSKTEIKKFSNAKRIRFSFINQIFWILTAILIGVFLISLKKINTSIPQNLASQFKDVGLGTMSLAIGLICEIKQKRNHYHQFLNLHNHSGNKIESE